MEETLPSLLLECNRTVRGRRGCLRTEKRGEKTVDGIGKQHRARRHQRHEAILVEGQLLRSVVKLLEFGVEPMREVIVDLLIHETAGGDASRIVIPELWFEGSWDSYSRPKPRSIASSTGE